MRIGFQVIFYLMLLNLVSTLVYAINVPGTEYTIVTQTGSQANATEIEQKFNATTLLDRWGATPFSGVPVFGDIFSGIYLVFNAISWVIAGFPLLLQTYVDLIPDSATRTTLSLINAVVIAVCTFIVFMWLFQLISGRRVTE